MPTLSHEPPRGGHPRMNSILSRFDLSHHIVLVPGREHILLGRVGLVGMRRGLTRRKIWTIRWVEDRNSSSTTASTPRTSFSLGKINNDSTSNIHPSPLPPPKLDGTIRTLAPPALRPLPSLDAQPLHTLPRDHVAAR